MPIDFGDNHFDAVTMAHVGMNIGDKARLFTELARVVRPGGRCTRTIMRCYSDMHWLVLNVAARS